MIQLAFQNHHHSRSRGNPKKEVASPHSPLARAPQPKQCPPIRLPSGGAMQTHFCVCCAAQRLHSGLNATSIMWRTRNECVQSAYRSSLLAARSLRGSRGMMQTVGSAHRLPFTSTEHPAYYSPPTTNFNTRRCSTPPKVRAYVPCTNSNPQKLRSSTSGTTRDGKKSHCF